MVQDNRRYQRHSLEKRENTQTLRIMAWQKESEQWFCLPSRPTFSKRERKKKLSATIAVSVLFRWHHNAQQAASGHSTLSQERSYWNGGHKVTGHSWPPLSSWTLRPIAPTFLNFTLPSAPLNLVGDSEVFFYLWARISFIETLMAWHQMPHRGLCVRTPVLHLLWTVSRGCSACRR